jgi:hypothetical protein
MSNHSCGNNSKNNNCRKESAKHCVSEVVHVFGIVGMSDAAIEAITGSRVLSDLNNWDRDINPSTSRLQRAVFTRSGIDSGNVNKGSLFTEYMTNHCKPSHRRDMVHMFDEDVWFEFLKSHEKQKQDSARSTGLIVVLFLMGMVIYSAGVIFPTVLLNRPALQNTLYFLDALCDLDEKFEVEVKSCYNTPCKCCVYQGETCVEY